MRRWIILRSAVARDVATFGGSTLLMGLLTWVNLTLADSPAPFWWVSGTLASLLLIDRRRRWALYLTAGFTGELAAHLLLGDPVLHSAFLVSVDVLEAGLAAGLIGRILNLAPPPVGLARLLALIGLGVLLPASVAAGLASLVQSTSSHVYSWQYFAGRFFPAALGLCITVPLLMGFAKGDVRALFRRNERMKSILILLAISLFSCLLLSQHSMPLLFLDFPPLLMVVTSLGFMGGVVSVGLMAVLGAVFSFAEGGLTVFHRPGPWTYGVLAYQLFLAAAIFSVTVVAIVLAERRRLERLAIESESRYRLIAEHSRDIIIMGLLDGTRKYVSPACVDILGWTPEELLGNTYEQTGHPEDVPLMRSQLAVIGRGQSVKDVAYRLRRKDGSYTWLEANISPYPDPVSGRIIGFVNVSRDITKRKSSEEDLQSAYLALEALATVDGLTGIANRRRLDEVLTLEWRRATRTRMPLSLVLLDVDHFKAYNDLYGHIRGDSCLKQIAEAALDVVGRPADLVARFGGEEFALVLPNTEESGAFDIAEQLRTAVEQRNLLHEGNEAGVVTVSAGCATITPQRGSSVLQIIEASDRALYAAKRNGRNRIEVAAALPGEEPVSAPGC